MKNIKRIYLTVIAALIFVGGFILVPKVLAATGQGTATIAVDAGAQGAGVTVAQSTSHVFTVILTVGVSGITTTADSPTFTIPAGFTTPHTAGGAVVPSNASEVDVDGEWYVIGGATCPVTMSSSGASGQVITVDVTTVCTVEPDEGKITLTYQGQSASAMGATALNITTAVDAGSGPGTNITAPPTITVTAAPTPTPTSTPTPTPTPVPSSTPTPTPTPTSGSGGSSSGESSSSTGSKVCPLLNYITPIIIEQNRISPTNVFVSWGPYSGINTFNIRYGFSRGNLPYNTQITGFSTTIDGLPSNQPIWVQVAATDNCSIGGYGEAKLVGGTGLPNTGLAPYNNTPRYIILAGIFLLPLFLLNLKHISFKLKKLRKRV